MQERSARVVRRTQPTPRKIRREIHRCKATLTRQLVINNWPEILGRAPRLAAFHSTRTACAREEKRSAITQIANLHYNNYIYVHKATTALLDRM